MKQTLEVIAAQAENAGERKEEVEGGCKLVVLLLEWVFLNNILLLRKLLYSQCSWLQKEEQGDQVQWQTGSGCLGKVAGRRQRRPLDWKWFFRYRGKVKFEQPFDCSCTDVML